MSEDAKYLAISDTIPMKTMVVHVWYAHEDARLAEQFGNRLKEFGFSIDLREFARIVESQPHFGDLRDSQFVILASPELAQSDELTSWLGELLNTVIRYSRQDYWREAYFEYRYCTGTTCHSLSR